jgi:hypothetical protein
MFAQRSAGTFVLVSEILEFIFEVIFVERNLFYFCHSAKLGRDLLFCSYLIMM